MGLCGNRLDNAIRKFMRNGSDCGRYLFQRVSVIYFARLNQTNLRAPETSLDKRTVQHKDSREIPFQCGVSHGLQDRVCEFIVPRCEVLQGQGRFFYLHAGNLC